MGLLSGMSIHRKLITFLSFLCSARLNLDAVLLGNGKAGAAMDQGQSLENFTIYEG